MSIRHPTRLHQYSDLEDMYPRELTELNGKLYIKNLDGSTTVLNQSAETFTVTVSTSWSGTTAPYSQTISVPGITSNDNPIADVVLSTYYATAMSQIEEWSKIYNITTYLNYIIIQATERTSLPLTVQLKRIKDIL